MDVGTRRTTSSKFGRSFRGFFRRIHGELGVKAGMDVFVSSIPSFWYIVRRKWLRNEEVMTLWNLPRNSGKTLFPAKPVRRREEEDARVGSAWTGRVGARESSKLSSENCHAFVTSCRSPWYIHTPKLSNVWESYGRMFGVCALNNVNLVTFCIGENCTEEECNQARGGSGTYETSMWSVSGQLFFSIYIYIRMLDVFPRKRILK